jgi:hypothetical protein
MISQYHRFALALAALSALLVSPARAEAPGEHPRYLSALADLRDAQWFLSHPREGAIEEREHHALEEIQRATGIVERAAAWDGKNPGERRPDDVDVERLGGRLRKVSALLRAARDDVAREEDNFAARVLQYRAVEHIDGAIRLVESVMIDRERAREREMAIERERAEERWRAEQYHEREGGHEHPEREERRRDGE